MDNLHNPYPSRLVKQTLARECGLAVKTVTQLLKDARKRIGWTTLCSERFRGSRQKIVDTASRVFSPDDVPSSLASDLMFEFSAIRSSATRLLDSVVDDLGEWNLPTGR